MHKFDTSEVVTTAVHAQLKALTERM